MTIMTILICVGYYSSVIVGIFIIRYFSKFIMADYRHNKQLNCKRIWAILYCYLIMAYSLTMVIMTKEEILKSIFIVLSAFLIFAFYAFYAGSLASPKLRKKNKFRKW